MNIYWTSLSSPDLHHKTKAYFHLFIHSYCIKSYDGQYPWHHTFSKINASPNAFCPRKVFLISSVLSSRNMSSKTLLLYFGVDSETLPSTHYAGTMYWLSTYGDNWEYEYISKNSQSNTKDSKEDQIISFLFYFEI